MHLRRLVGGDLLIIGVFFVSYVTFATTVPRFVDSGGNLLVRAAADGIVALGLMTVMVQGELDLSVGSTLALSAALTMGMAGSVGYPAAALIGVVVGALIGFANGLIVTRAHVNSFIATLGTMVAIRGLVFAYTGGQPISGPSLDVAVSFSQPVLLGLTPRVLLLFGAALGVGVLLAATKVGRDLYAVGGSREAATAAGIRVERRLWLGFVVSGVLASIAGSVISIELNTGSPVLGSQTALVAITATVIGGTSLMGGRGTALGTLLGVLVLASIGVGLNLARVPSSYQQVITGAVLVAVVLADQARGRPRWLRGPISRRLLIGKGEQGLP